jgi:hypothetical protein
MMAVRSVFLSLAVTLIAPSISRGQVERIHAYHSCKHRPAMTPSSSMQFPENDVTINQLTACFCTSM